jgi:hypothetical protein
MPVNFQWPTDYCLEESPISRANAVKKEEWNFPVSREARDWNKCPFERFPVSHIEEWRVRVVRKQNNEWKVRIGQLA